MTFCRIWTSLVKLVLLFYFPFFLGGKRRCFVSCSSSFFSGFGPVCSNFFVGRGEAVTFCRIWTSFVKLVCFFFFLYYHYYFFWGGGGSDVFLFSSVFSGFGPVCSNFFVGRGEAVTFCRIWTSFVKLVCFFFFLFVFFLGGGIEYLLEFGHPRMVVLLLANGFP